MLETPPPCSNKFLLINVLRNKMWMNRAQLKCMQIDTRVREGSMIIIEMSLECSVTWTRFDYDSWNCSLMNFNGSLCLDLGSIEEIKHNWNAITDHADGPNRVRVWVCDDYCKCRWNVHWAWCLFHSNLWNGSMLKPRSLNTLPFS